MGLALILFIFPSLIDKVHEKSTLKRCSLRYVLYSVRDSAFRVVQFQTGQYTDTEYEIPFPDGWEFWNTMLLNFSIDLEGSLRDAIHTGAVDVWSSRGYTIKNAKGTSRNAWALIYKFR